MSKAYMTFPDGGRIYRDAAGRLVAYTAAGGTAARKRVKTEAAGELWLAHAWLAANPAFLPDLPPAIREMNVRLKWRREAQLESETDPAKRRALAEEISFIRLKGRTEETPEIAAELDFLRPDSATAGDSGGGPRVLSRAELRDAFAAIDLLRDEAPGRTLLDAARALVAAEAGLAPPRRRGRPPGSGRAAAKTSAAPSVPDRPSVLTLGEVARTLAAVYAKTPDILEPAVYELFGPADPATALEMAARRRKGKPVSNSPVVDKWLKIVRKAEASPPGVAPASPPPTTPARLARRTAEALREAGVSKTGADLLRHTGNAFLWRREAARGNGEDAAMRMRLPRASCETFYNGVDIAPLDVEAFFALSPFELARRFLAPALAKLRAGAAPAPGDRDRETAETLRRLAPPAGGRWDDASAIVRDMAAFNPAFGLRAF